MRSLLAYDADGKVIATLDHAVARGPNGKVVGLLDFAAHEDAGGEALDIWRVDGAAGSKTWPEFLGGGALGFTVEKDGPAGRKHLSALVHPSGHRRERAAVEAAIAKVKPDAKGRRDIRHIVGGPTKPLLLDDRGRTKRPETVTAPRLPIISR